MTSAAAKELDKARAAVERWTESIKRCGERLESARKRRDAKAVLSLEEKLVRVTGNLDSAEKRVEKLTRLLNFTTPLLRRTAAAETNAAKIAIAREKDGRRKRPPQLKSESRATGAVLVDSPYGHGTDAVVRVFSTIEAMHKRRQVGDREKWAAQRFNWAYETCPSALRCALNQSGGGSSVNDHSPTEDQLWAVEYLRQAKRILGVVDYRVVELICGEGLSIEEAARRRYGGKAKRASGKDRVVIGDRVRTALQMLADEWWPEKHRMRGSRAPDAKPLGADERDAWDSSVKGRVAHAADSGERGSNATGKVFGFKPLEGHLDLRLNRKDGRRKKAKGKAA